MRPRPEVAPLYAHAQAAIRQSLEKRMAPPPAPVETPAEELSEEDKLALAQHYQSVK